MLRKEGNPGGGRYLGWWEISNARAPLGPIRLGTTLDPLARRSAPLGALALPGAAGDVGEGLIVTYLIEIISFALRCVTHRSLSKLRSGINSKGLDRDAVIYTTEK